MPLVTVPTTGVEIDYELLAAPVHLGEPAERPTVLMVHGLGCQWISWPPALLDLLVAAGLRVVVFDNRDSGASTHASGSVDIGALLAGTAPAPAYTLSDLAADAVGLLNRLGLASAHVVGTSLGGMIAQAIAIEYPHRVDSLTSISSAPGFGVGRTSPEAAAALLAPRTGGRDEAAARALASNKVIGSPGYEPDEELIAERAVLAWDRDGDPNAAARQLAAIVAGGDRRPALAELNVPTLVVHGEDDPLIGVDAAKETASTISGSTLLTIPGMGHDLPPAVIPTIAEAVIDHIRRSRYG